MEIFLNVFSLSHLLVIVIGVFFGAILGALPGVGTILALTLALPFTFALEPSTAIALLLAIYAASIYGGSISAVLINAPGTPQSAATCLDGYPLSQQGKAHIALGWVTSASAFGGLVSVVLLVLLAPQLAKISKSFGPVEIFALLIFALVCVSVASRESSMKGLIAVLAGLFLAMIGIDPMTGDMRYTFGFFELSAGVQFIPVLVGLFAISEVLVLVSERAKQTQQHQTGRLAIFVPSPSDWLRHLKTLLKSAGIGSFFGLLPGPGALISSFVAYSEAKRSSPEPEKFGHGAEEGLIASESANNAVTGGAMIPTLSLGIPGDAATAVMLTALMIHGVAPGPQLFEQNSVLVWNIMGSLAVVNLVMLVIGLLCIPAFSSILRVPKSFLVPTILLLSVAGTFALRQSYFDLMTMLVAGTVGYLLRKAEFPLAPIVIGLILGARLELSLRQGLILTNDSLIAFLYSPIALCLLLAAAALITREMLRAILTLRNRGRPCPGNS